MVVVTNVLLKPTFVSIFVNQIEMLIFYMVPILKLSQLHGSQKKILAIPCSPLEFSKLNDLTYFLSSIYSNKSILYRAYLWTMSFPVLSP